MTTYDAVLTLALLYATGTLAMLRLDARDRANRTRWGMRDGEDY